MLLAARALRTDKQPLALAWSCRLGQGGKGGGGSAILVLSAAKKAGREIVGATPAKSISFSPGSPRGASRSDVLPRSPNVRRSLVAGGQKVSFSLTWGGTGW